MSQASRALITLCLLLFSPFVYAANSGITYQGRILKPDGTPISGSTTQFKLQIRTPDSNSCLMYEEIQTQNLSGMNGTFSLTINEDPALRTDSSGFNPDRIFSNHGTFSFPSANCLNGSGTVAYSPSSGDGRTLAVYFKDETMGSWEPIPPAKINFVPFAFESKQVQGFGADSLLRVVGAGGDPLTGVSPLSNTQYSELLLLLAGTSAQYTHAGQLGGSPLPTMATGQVLGWNGSAWTSSDPLTGVQTFAKTALPTCASNNFLRNNGSGVLECIAPAIGGGGTVTQVDTGTGLTGGGFTTTGTISIAAQGVDTAQLKDGGVTLVKMAANSVDSTKIVDGSIAGADLSSAINITTTGTVATGASTTRDFKLFPSSGSKSITFAAPVALAADYTLTWPLDDGTPSQVLTTDGSGGLTWSTPAGTGISALTGDVTAGGTGSVPATVASVGGSTATQVHQSQLDTAAATAANAASTIVKRDGSGNFAAGVVTANGVTLNNAGSLLNILNPTGGAWTMTLPATAGVNGQVLTTNGAGVLSWGAAAASSQWTDHGVNISYDGGGNVGIGTTSPSSRLHVVGPNTGGYPLTIEAAPGSGPSAYLNLALNNKTSGAYKSAIDFQNSGTTKFSLGTDYQGNGTNNFGLFDNSAGVHRWFVDSAGNVGIGTTAPATKLQVNGSVLVGDGGETCGATYAGAIRYNGGNLQFCNGTPPWSTLGIAGAGVTALTGDVTASGTGSVAATVAVVGGSTAAQVHSAELAANAATNANTASTIVKRDSSGNFTAGTIDVYKVSNSMTEWKAPFGGTITLQAPILVSTPYALKLPVQAPASSGQVLASTTAGDMSWVTIPTSLPPNGSASGDLSGNYPNPGVATVGTSTAANIHAAELLANAATSSNTNTTIVKRDGSGNFSSNVATANGFTLNNGGSLLNIVNPVGGAWTMTLPATAGSNGQVLTTNGSGLLSWAAAGGGGGFLNGGNSFGATSSLGNNDNFDLNIKTNNLSRLTVTAGGNVGIGTTSPSGTLEITPAAVGTKPFVVRAIASQTAKLSEWQNSAGTALYGLDPSGAPVAATDLATKSYVDASAGGGNFVAKAGDAMTGPLQFSSGNALSPSITPTGDSNTGLYSGAPDTLSITAGGGEQLRATSLGLQTNVISKFLFGYAADLTNTYGIVGTTSLGLGQCTNANCTTFSSYLQAASTAVTIYTPTVYMPSGASVSAPGMSYGSDTNTGLYHPANDVMSLVTSGAQRLTVVSTGKVGIGTTSPNALLDVKGSIVMSGATSGYTGFQPAASAGSTVWTLPTADGSSGQALVTNGSGILSWTTPSGGGITDLTGDVTASGSGSVAATVGTVGTSTAANIHSAELLANAATSANTASTIVKRDGTGAFAAGVVTTDGVALKNAGSTLNIVNPVGGAWTMTLPATAGSNNQVLTTNGAGLLSWTTAAGGSQWTTHGANVSYDGAGNVGIGTTSPAAVLHVVQPDQGFGGATQPALYVKGGDAVSGGPGGGITMITGYGDVAGGAMYLESKPGGLMTLKGGGGVELSSGASADTGSPLPMNLTTQASPGYQTGGDVSIAAGHSGPNMYSRGGNVTINPGAANSPGVSGNILLATSNGNVGIGTTAPMSPLEVVGTVRSNFFSANRAAPGGYANFSLDNKWLMGVGGASDDFYLEENAAATRLVIQKVTGNVGIGTTAPSQMLEVNGTIKATDIILTSDARAKHNITSLDSSSSLEKVCRVRPVSFNWNYNGKPDEGVIAQEIREIFPEFVIQNPDGSLSVKYSSLIAPLISSVQELKTRNDQLAARVTALESDRARVEKIEKENQQLRDDVAKIMRSLASEKGKK